MVDLELATYNQIATELARRNDVVVLLTTRPGKVGPTADWRSVVHGNTLTALGMLHHATVLIQHQILTAQRQQEQEDPPCP